MVHTIESLKQSACASLNKELFVKTEQLQKRSKFGNTAVQTPEGIKLSKTKSRARKEAKSLSEMVQIPNSETGRWGKGKEKVERSICIECKNRFYCPPCYKKRGGNSGKFCSQKCYGIYRSRRMSIQNKVEREIKLIKKTSRHEAYIKRCENFKAKNNICQTCGSKCKKKFCDRKCYYQFVNLNMEKLKIRKICRNCGKEMLLHAGQVNSGEGIFCSLSCHHIFRTKQTKNTYSNSLGGKREDLNDKYFRSRWEANYARYLNLLITLGEVIKWEYETETFRFEKIKKGIQSYTPDFKIYYTDGRIRRVEIKGYMSDASRTKLSRMKKYYPDIIIELFTVEDYKVLTQRFKGIIPNWEVNNKKGI